MILFFIANIIKKSTRKTGISVSDKALNANCYAQMHFRLICQPCNGFLPLINRSIPSLEERSHANARRNEYALIYLFFLISFLLRFPQNPYVTSFLCEPTKNILSLFFLLNGNSLFGATRLSSGFRYTKNPRGVPSRIFELCFTIKVRV